jgi:hypothetical protein
MRKIPVLVSLSDFSRDYWAPCGGVEDVADDTRWGRVIPVVPRARYALARRSRRKEGQRDDGQDTAGRHAPRWRRGVEPSVRANARRMRSALEKPHAAATWSSPLPLRSIIR